MQGVGGLADLALEVGVGDRPGVARLADPVERDLVAEAALDVPVDAVVGDVELAADEPLGERQVPLERGVERRRTSRSARGRVAPRRPPGRPRPPSYRAAVALAWAVKAGSGRERPRPRRGGSRSRPRLASSRVRMSRVGYPSGSDGWPLHSTRAVGPRLDRRGRQLAERVLERAGAQARPAPPRRAPRRPGRATARRAADAGSRCRPPRTRPAAACGTRRRRPTGRPRGPTPRILSGHAVLTEGLDALDARAPRGSRRFHTGSAAHRPTDLVHDHRCARVDVGPVRDLTFSLIRAQTRVRFDVTVISPLGIVWTTPSRSRRVVRRRLKSSTVPGDAGQARPRRPC